MSNGAALRKLTAWERKLETVTDPGTKGTRMAALEIRKDISRNFDNEVSPYGKAWSKRKHDYKHRPLQKTRKMRKSWRVVTRGMNEIGIRSNDPKSRFHQEGTFNMDARPAAPNSAGLPKKYSALIKSSVISELSLHFNRMTGL